jgi:integrase
MGVKVRERLRGSGQWWVFVNHHGRRKAISVGTRKAAQNVAD